MLPATNPWRSPGRDISTILPRSSSKCRPAFSGRVTHWWNSSAVISVVVGAVISVHLLEWAHWSGRGECVSSLLDQRQREVVGELPAAWQPARRRDGVEQRPARLGGDQLAQPVRAPVLPHAVAHRQDSPGLLQGAHEGDEEGGAGADRRVLVLTARRLLDPTAAPDEHRAVTAGGPDQRAATNAATDQGGEPGLGVGGDGLVGPSDQ